MQSLELTSNQIKELQETGRVTVEREVKNFKKIDDSSFSYEGGFIHTSNIEWSLANESPFKVGEVYTYSVDCKDIDVSEISNFVKYIKFYLIGCLTSEIKEKDGKWYWVGEFELERN